MPTISVEQNLIRGLLAKHGLVHDVAVMHEQLPLLGTDIDTCDENVLDIEIFPDRPALLSGETLTKAIRPFLHGVESEPSLEVMKGDISMTVDPELEHIRPVVVGAVVRGITIDGDLEEKDAFIKALMDHQEKLHFALGRGRRRASIGVHDLSTISPPFRVRAASPDTRFCPLGMDE